MLSRILIAVVLGCLLILPANAQTVRFDTNVGNIDFLLNPTGNPNLVPHVDNILAYVNAGLYDSSFINRAATGFVLQFGGFSLDPLVPPASPDDFIDIPSFDPVVVDADGDFQVDFIFDVDGDDDVDSDDASAFGLSNTTGTVSLALSSVFVDGQSMVNPNSGTSSFFVNLNDNGFLDDQGFVPFATVPDTTTVDLITSLPQLNLDPTGANLAAINVPLVNDANVVFIERAFVLEDEDVSNSITFSTLTSAETAAETAVVTFSTVTGISDDSPTTFSDLSLAEDIGATAPVTFSVLTMNEDVQTFTSSSLTAGQSASTTATGDGSLAVQAVAVPEPPALVLAIGALVAIYMLKPSKR
ncbi:MAG: peptidylprolyl isomerase [Planctomycetota bacterium]